nr:MAG TPA: hypothetical protein [Caudoviricetes sp.]
MHTLHIFVQNVHILYSKVWRTLSHLLFCSFLLKSVNVVHFSEQSVAYILHCVLSLHQKSKLLT